MFVKSCTIGGNVTFALLSENISRSGLLLAWHSKHRAPFQEKTIIQMTIDSESHMFESPLTCLGKIVRIAMDDSDCRKYGVRIIQMTPKDQAIWDMKINELGADEALA